MRFWFSLKQDSPQQGVRRFTGMKSLFRTLAALVLAIGLVGGVIASVGAQANGGNGGTVIIGGNTNDNDQSNTSDQDQGQVVDQDNDQSAGSISVGGDGTSVGVGVNGGCDAINADDDQA